MIEKTADFVEALLKEKLPGDLCYHDLPHSMEVARAALEIGKGEGLTPDELEIVVLAAWLHDTGYTEQYIGHEEESQLIAEKFLQENGYPDEKITIICNCIIATKFRHEAGNVLESVVIDADRLSMGTPEFMERGELLRKEWEIYLGKVYTDREWVDVQINYLLETDFLTSYVRDKYGGERILNLKLLKERSLRLEKESATITEHSRKGIRLAVKLVRSVAITMALGLFIGITLSIIVWGFRDYALGIGTISGFLIGLVLKLADRPFEYRIIRRFSFPVSLLIGTLTLIILFKASQFASVVIYDLMVAEVNFDQIQQTQVFRDIISWNSIFNMLWTALMVSAMLNFIKLTSRIIGPRLMMNYMKGLYHKPVEEERIFMFIDLNSSTSLAERMQPVTYHRLLNRFFNDIANPINRFDGEIYQYVGDEVVVTWKMKDGLKDANCVRCYFRILRQMEKLRSGYEKEFGFMPEFKVGMHGGEVITGEVGKNKTEIVFHGDVINTTERILNQCINLGKKMLISENLLRRLDLAPNIHAEYVTTRRFKGKENEVSLYTLWRESR